MSVAQTPSRPLDRLMKNSQNAPPRVESPAANAEQARQPDGGPLAVLRLEDLAHLVVLLAGDLAGGVAAPQDLF
jgi:hypothetical protein